MIPALVGIGAALAVLVIGWLLASGVRLVRSAHWQLTEERRLARMRHADRQHRSREEAAGGHDPEQILIEARREAEAIVSEAERRADEIVAAAESEKEDRLASLHESAGRTAGAIVKEAEQKAGEIVAAAALARARLEQEVAEERKLADEKRGELSAFLLSLLSEVQRTTGVGETNLRMLSRARELKAGRAETGE